MEHILCYQIQKGDTMVKVSNMINSNGNQVVNQYIIRGVEVDGKVYTAFQSYDKIIATKSGGQITLDEYYWNYSKTTGRYRNIFLNEGMADTKRKIEEGIYKLEDLN
jgi:hypothetical protein